MTITLSFDPLNILGIIFLSVVASFVGNILAGHAVKEELIRRAT